MPNSFIIISAQTDGTAVGANSKLWTTLKRISDNITQQAKAQQGMTPNAMRGSVSILKDAVTNRIWHSRREVESNQLVSCTWHACLQHELVLCTWHTCIQHELVSCTLHDIHAFSMINIYLQTSDSLWPRYHFLLVFNILVKWLNQFNGADQNFQRDVLKREVCYLSVCSLYNDLQKSRLL